MTKIIITRKMPFHFESGISIEESKTSRIISGTLLREGISRNGRIYTIEEMVKISKQAVGIPIYYGVDLKNRHKKGEPIGKIVRAHFDEKLKTIKFWARITSQKIVPQRPHPPPIIPYPPPQFIIFKLYQI